jgi:hypothetical protein
MVKRHLLLAYSNLKTVMTQLMVVGLVGRIQILQTTQRQDGVNLETSLVQVNHLHSLVFLINLLMVIKEYVSTTTITY